MIKPNDERKPWDYLQKEPDKDAPITDNPSGMYCKSCRGAGMAHCSSPEYCGGMKLMMGGDDDN